MSSEEEYDAGFLEEHLFEEDKPRGEKTSF